MSPHFVFQSSQCHWQRKTITTKNWSINCKQIMSTHMYAHLNTNIFIAYSWNAEQVLVITYRLDARFYVCLRMVYWDCNNLECQDHHRRGPWGGSSSYGSRELFVVSSSARTILFNKEAFSWGSYDMAVLLQNEQAHTNTVDKKPIYTHISKR